jgi:hypothetical protein
MPIAETESPAADAKSPALSRPAREKDRVGSFAHRHIGPNKAARAEMLAELDFENLEALIDATVPGNIRLDGVLNLPEARTESEALEELRALAKKNSLARSFIGAGYSDTITPPVIQRNILENPGWYTAYTPYQAEIAQGRLEALLNFQTMITDLTALDIANASLLDEGTAAAEAMALCRGPHFLSPTIAIRKRSRSCKRERSRSGSKSSSVSSRASSSTRRFSAHSSSIPRRTARSSITNLSRKPRMTRAHCSSSPLTFWR